MKKLKPYISLMRLNYQVNFIEVIAGVIFVSPLSSLPFSTIFLKVLLLFFCFGILYGGIYTLNDIADIEEDKKDRRKKLRALPSGKISIRNALTYSIFLMILGISLAFLLLSGIVGEIFLLFLIINLFYTFLFKRIAFVELLVNCLTHPLRLVLGASLFGGSIPLLFLLGVYFVTTGFGLKIRLIMMENDGVVSRPSLHYYTESRITILKFLFIILIIVSTLFDGKTDVGWYIFLLFLYMMFVLDLPFFAFFGKLFRRVYIGR
ncbi:MAG TPA: UbiA family prenyltransferase [Candidatus Sulfotelmatobacter sp.]|jgi:4-hydroxybenzoate polyprenyltransferase|nr:UbiA family prenyltransferase [Candidatus Sulfotelmatobacter sp.]